MAIYLKWHMCPCHEPFVAQISICSDTFGRVEYIRCLQVTKSKQISKIVGITCIQQLNGVIRLRARFLINYKHICCLFVCSLVCTGLFEKTIEPRELKVCCLSYKALLVF